MLRLQRVPGVVLISVAAAMWGLDGLIRKPLSDSTTAYTIVFGEHVLLVALTLPLLVPAFRGLWRAGPAYVAAGVAVGAGASAIATILFTKALFHGDFITVVVLQKAQPLIAVVGAWLVLGEQPRRGLVPIVETLAAAALWGMGTVFGRFLGRRLEFEHITTVRFAFGLVASACALPIVGAGAFSNAHDSFWIAVLALVTGFLALNLYYYGLRRTPALLAAIGELAFPVTATLVGIYVIGDKLTQTQWIGVAVTVAVISLLPMRRREVVSLPEGEP